MSATDLILNARESINWNNLNNSDLMQETEQMQILIADITHETRGMVREIEQMRMSAADILRESRDLINWENIRTYDPIQETEQMQMSVADIMRETRDLINRANIRTSVVMREIERMQMSASDTIRVLHAFNMLDWWNFSNANDMHIREIDERNRRNCGFLAEIHTYQAVRKFRVHVKQEMMKKLYHPDRFWRTVAGDPEWDIQFAKDEY